MEQLQDKPLSEKQLRMILVYGLIISSISIIFSVDYLFKEKMFLELGVASGLFAVILISIRKLNSPPPTKL